MSQPTPYTPTFSFSTYALNNPAAPYNAPQLDIQLEAISTSINELVTNIGLIQRDDGALANGVVTVDSFSTAAKNMIGGSGEGWNPRGAWVTNTIYEVKDIVTTGGLTYVCNTEHLSAASFSTDLAAGYWNLINGLGAAPALFSDISFSTNNVILGRVSSGAGAGEEITCTAAGRALLDDASASAQRTTLGVGTADSPAFANVTATTLTASGLTANGAMYASTAGLLASTAAMTNGQILIGRTGLAPILGTLTQTANQVLVTNGAGTITLSTPQDIHTAATPSFAGLFVTGLSQSSIPFIGPSSALSQDTSNFIWDDTNKRLALGLNAPTERLHLYRATTGPNIKLETDTNLTTVGLRFNLAAQPFDSAMDVTYAAGNTGFQFSTYDGIAGTFVEAKLEAEAALLAAAKEGFNTKILTVDALLSPMVGPTMTATNLIPAGSLVYGVTLRVNTLITGASSFDVGDGSDADRWGSNIALALGTTTTIANFTIASPVYYTAATSVVLTADTADFTAGAVRVVVHYVQLTPPTS